MPDCPSWRNRPALQPSGDSAEAFAPSPSAMIARAVAATLVCHGLSKIVVILSPDSFCFEVTTTRSDQAPDLVPVETPHHAEGPDRFRSASPQDHATKACLERQRRSRLSGRTPEEPTHRRGRSAAAVGTVAEERTPEASTESAMAGRRPARRPSLFSSQPDDGLIEIVFGK